MHNIDIGESPTGYGTLLHHPVDCSHIHAHTHIYTHTHTLTLTLTLWVL